VSLLAALALGLVIGLSLGALGGGGSILTVPALVYVLHESSTAATTASLVIVGVTALAGSIGHARAGRVRWKAGIIFGVLGIPASYLGTALNRTVNPHVLLLCLGALMIIAAAGMLLRTRSGSDQSAPAAALARTGGSDSPGRYPSSSGTSATTASRRGIEAAATTKMVLAALLVGFLTGFLGVGGGFVIVPALVMVLAFPMPIAVGTSLLIIAINSAAALTARTGQETFDWAVILQFTAAAILGSVAGKRVADKVSGPALSTAFAGLLVAVAVYVIAQSLLALR